MIVPMEYQQAFQDFERFLEDRSAVTREVQALRGNHNLSPDTAMSGVAAALRRNVDVAAFEAVLATLQQEARDFWRA